MFIVNSSIIVLVSTLGIAGISCFFSCKYASEVGCKNICFFPSSVVVLDLGLVGSILNLPIPGLIVVLDL